MVFRRIGLIILVIGLVSAPSWATELFPLDQVHPGMHGIGKTVVQGTKIEEFHVEIISVVSQHPPTPSLVMIKVSGDVIDRSGGIAAGMSGSPVYIEDKLLGAIGYGYALTDHRVGLVTPAERMLELLGELPSEIVEPVLPKDASPLKTPLMVSGISGRALEYLTSRLNTDQLQLIPGVTGQSDSDAGVPFQPGSAFGVQLLRGDFQAVAFGTVTHVEDHKFVGFGHPFLHRGVVNYFVTPATIHYTMPSLDFPFKIASAGVTVGSLYQDRAAGVAGVIGTEPSYVPVRIFVQDKTRNRTREYRVETVPDENLVGPLAVSSVYQGIDATLDRIGKGTAYVRLEFDSEDIPNTVVRENMFYSDSDIAVWALYDLVEGLDLLLANKLQPVDLSQVNARITVEEQRKTASIEKAIPRQFQVVAGESMEVEVTIRPYRDLVEYRVLRIDVPEDTLPGLMTVTVRGGGSGYYASKPTVHSTLQSIEEDDSENRLEPSGGESLEKLIETYMRREQNNEIVAEFYPFIDSYRPVDQTIEALEPGIDSESIDGVEGDELLYFSDISGTESAYFRFHWDDTSNEPIRVRLTTQFVIEGVATFDLEVVKP